MTKKLSELTPEQQSSQRASVKRYKARNKPRLAAQSAARHKERYATDSEYRARKDAGAERARVKRLYGLTEADVDAALEAQNHLCPICDEPLTKRHIDHCHRTGRFRAVLCPSCNVFLGKIEASPDRLKRALEYIKGHR